jgi:hypothetical protein
LGNPKFVKDFFLKLGIPKFSGSGPGMPIFLVSLPFFRGCL